MNTATILLPSLMKGQSLVALGPELLSRRGSDLDLDASAVDEFDHQALALMLAAFRSWRHDRRRLRIVDPSPVMLHAFIRLTESETFA